MSGLKYIAQMDVQACGYSAAADVYEWGLHSLLRLCKRHIFINNSTTICFYYLPYSACIFCREDITETQLQSKLHTQPKASIRNAQVYSEMKHRF